MSCHKFVKKLSYSLLCLGLLSLNGVAFAQVYKSYDADGRVIFSDKPTESSNEVEVSQPNVSDSFEVPPPAPTLTSPETRPTPPASDSETQPTVDDETADTNADTNNDGRISRREKEEHREKRRKKKRKEAKASESDNE